MTDPRSWFPLRVATLGFARDCLHVREEGYNRGAMVEEFQKEAEIRPGAPWCAAFVNWCAKQAAELKGIASPLEAVPLEGYVQSYVDYGREQGWVRADDEEPGVGDLFCMFFGHLDDGEGRYGHIGFVESIGERYFDTIEGNTGSGGEREGDGVYTRTRRLDMPNLILLDWTRDLDEEAE